MDVSVPQTNVRTRTPLGMLGKLTIVGLIGIAVGYVYLQAVMIGQLIPPLTVFVVLALVIAGLVTTGWRWVPLLGALLSVLILMGSLENITYNLAHPGEFSGFVFTVVVLAMMVLAVGAGLAATVQNYRSRARTTPRSLPLLLSALVGLCLGTIMVAAVAAQDTGAGISPTTLASLPALTTASFAFDQSELHVRAGEFVALRLDNKDSEAHSFDVDELDVHALIPSGKPGVALFKALKPGTYLFYCAPHYNKETGEGMKGTLVVEQ